MKQIVFYFHGDPVSDRNGFGSEESSYFRGNNQFRFWYHQGSRRKSIPTFEVSNHGAIVPLVITCNRVLRMYDGMAERTGSSG